MRGTCGHGAQSKNPGAEELRQLILHGSVRERLRSEHLEWLSQLKSLARNLNQLTRLAHAQGFAAVTARHATLQANGLIKRLLHV